MSAFPHPRLILGAAALLLATHAHADHVKVFLLGGQSNMVGNNCLTSELPAALQSPQADVLFYPGSLTTLQPGYGGQFGPEVTFGRTVADEFPSDTYCLIKYAVNGSSLLTSWNPATGTSYAGFRTRVENGIAALTAAGHTYEFAGMLWTQGEAEAAAGTTTPVYQAALNEFIADVRTRYGPNLPFFVSRLSSAQTNIPANGLSTIRAAQEYVVANDPFTYLIDTDGFSVYTDNLHFNAAGQIALGQAFGQSYVASVVPDETAPEIALLSPANGFTEHPATNNLVINFTEPVVFGTGFITVRESAGGTLIESYDVANPPANLSSNLSGATLTIDLSFNLNYSTGYYVEIDSTAIADNSGNSFAGFSGPSTWSFITAAGQAGGLIDGSGITPTASSVNVTTSFSLMGAVNGAGLNGLGEHGSGNQSEWYTANGQTINQVWIAFDLGGSYVLDSIHVWNTVQFPTYGIQNVDIYVSDAYAPGDPEGAGSANWTKIGDNVSFAAAGTPNIGFDLEAQTGISLPTTAVRHVRFEVNTNLGGGYVGLAEVQFFAAPSGPDTTDPTISSLDPVNGASNVPTTANLVATFSEPVAFGTGFITVRETAGGTPVASYDVASPPANLSLSGATLTINPSADLAASTGYYVEIDSTAIDDLVGNSFAGVSGPLAWSFTTNAPDNTSPTISSLDPVNGASNVPTTANLVATFSEPVAFGTGFITVRETEGGTPVASYDVASPPANLSLSGATLTINPSADLAASTGYYVEIDSTAIDDLVGNSFAGISGSASWSFITAAAQPGGTIVVAAETTAAGTVTNTTSPYDGDILTNDLINLGSSTLGTVTVSGSYGFDQNGIWDGVGYNAGGNSNGTSYISGSTVTLTFDLIGSVTGYDITSIISIAGWYTNAQNHSDQNYEVLVSTVGDANYTALALTGAVDGSGHASVNSTVAGGYATKLTITESGNGVIASGVDSIRFVLYNAPSGLDGDSVYHEIDVVGSATVSPGNDFADWIGGFNVGGQIGINDDFDNDGLGNALENLMGTSPEVFNPGLTSVSASGGNLVFRHTLSSTPASDLTGSYEWSANLVDWNASGVDAGGTTVTFGTPGVITPGTPNLVEVTASVTGTPAAEIFARYKATQN